MQHDGIHADLDLQADAPLPADSNIRQHGGGFKSQDIEGNIGRGMGGPRDAEDVGQMDAPVLNEIGDHVDPGQQANQVSYMSTDVVAVFLDLITSFC